MLKQKKVYLDYNASTPVDKRVLSAMLPYFTDVFGNPNSDHCFGWDAHEAVEMSRQKVAQLTNAKPKELIFTSGATEAAQFAIFGHCKANELKGKHIVTCKTEHKAILNPIQILEQQGFEVTYLNVNSDGHINLEELDVAITNKTSLVCLMLANNETGLIHPIENIAKIVHKKGAKLLCDITQALGKIPVDLKLLNVDYAVCSAHKLYGPKGVGALYINKSNGVTFNSISSENGQEQVMRPGTLNVPGIVGFGTAAKIALDEMAEESIRIALLRQKLESSLQEIEGAHINSKNAARLPNTTNISFANSDGNHLLRRLSMLAISRGSACTSNLILPSHVLKAMGLSDELALSSFRFSIGRYTLLADIEFASEELKLAVDSLQNSMV